jgi:uncharacterized protein YdiU (UPF0061 family)
MAQTMRRLRSQVKTAPREYEGFEQIDGTHPFKEYVPGGFVDYQVRQRHGGNVAYFNFDLAREMGLIRNDHKDQLNASLSHAILDTFSIMIINEHDFLSGKRFPESDIKPNRYMATRYLQLQHRSRTGITSGDGRSIWNGMFQNKQGRSWDISSCGTGATCLSPARALNNKFYKSGDPSVSYGCGLAETSDGITNAVFSEVLHRNGIPTERTLAVIEYTSNTAIVVRAHPNLLRPSHFFNHLKQGKLHRLKGAVNLYIDRQIGNGQWKGVPRDSAARYKFMLNDIATSFARMSARFEREYIFCWLDWDGDNILTDSSVIDYGSIRQFGLFHHKYRYDDVQRWSTNLKEQRAKARLIVQTFAQMVSYLITGDKKPLTEYRRDPILKRFDEEFEKHRATILLKKIGLPDKIAEQVMSSNRRLVMKFQAAFDYLERAKSSRGIQKLEDGEVCYAIFSMRNLLREFPKHLVKNKRFFSPEEMMSVMRSSFSSRDDRTLTCQRRALLQNIQQLMRQVLQAGQKFARTSEDAFLKLIEQRATMINREERVTGDGIINLGGWLMRRKRKLKGTDFHDLVTRVIEKQILDPDRVAKIGRMRLVKEDELLKQAQQIIHENREGI